MPKISALPPAGSLHDDDETPFVDDSTSQTKKFTLAGLKAWLQSLASWITTAMIGNNQVTAIKTAFGGDYSTSEVNTGFKWVDGKDIYKKTINFGALPNNTSKSVAHGITNLESIIDCAGVAISGTTVLNLNEYDGSNYIRLIPRQGVNITIFTSSDRTTYLAYVTLWYTKT